VVTYNYAVDGGWTEWKYEHPCSVTCSKGIEIFSRTCTNPKPECGGKECDGLSKQAKTCYAQIPCPCKLNNIAIHYLNFQICVCLCMCLCVCAHMCTCTSIIIGME